MVRPRREMNEFIVFNICSLYCLDKNENYVDSREALGEKKCVRHPYLQLLIIPVSR